MNEIVAEWVDKKEEAQTVVKAMRIVCALIRPKLGLL